jgi:Protein of unknown function (DUF433)
VIKGTRLAVEFIIDLLAQGWSEAEILKNHPGLTREDIQACLGYASTVLHSEEVSHTGRDAFSFWPTRIFRARHSLLSARL